jgi:WD40 repeat protein
MEETNEQINKKTTFLRKQITLEEILQVDSHQKFNFHFFNPQTLLFSAGRSFQILNMDCLKITKVLSKSPGGIGCVAIHPDKKVFAVAEKGTHPSIYIYSFPQIQKLAELKNGTEKAFKHIEFSPSGDKLASLGCAPDYSLALWDWKAQVLSLKAKAFSQEVVRVSFSRFSEKILATSGLTHIKFWNVANTFTGLKLKGYIGKFGVVQMTDISGFAIFPDEKVLSGSETGELLLWESHFVKAILHEKGKKNCHE